MIPSLRKRCLNSTFDLFPTVLREWLRVLGKGRGCDCTRPEIGGLEGGNRSMDEGEDTGFESLVNGETEYGRSGWSQPLRGLISPRTLDDKKRL